MGRLIKYLQAKGFSFNTPTRGYITKLPLNTQSIKEPDLLQDFQRYEKRNTAHPQWVTLENINNRFIKVSFTNETTKKTVENNVLLYKIGMKNSNYNFLGKGITKTFDLNDPTQCQELISFILDFKPKAATKNQVFPQKDTVIYQEIEEDKPEHFRALIIQSQKFTDAGLPKVHNENHALKVNGIIKEEEYKDAQKEHANRAIDSNLSLQHKKENLEIATRMVKVIKEFGKKVS